MVFYAYLLLLIGVTLASILVWKRRINLGVSIFINTFIPTILFILGIFVDSGRANDPSTGGAYTFFMIFATPIVFLLSSGFLYVVVGAEKLINGTPDEWNG